MSLFVKTLIQRKKLLKVFVCLKKPIWCTWSTQKTCENWFKQFQSNDFDVSAKNDLVKQKIIEDGKLEALLKENSAQTEKQFGKQLNASQAPENGSKRKNYFVIDKSR